MSIVIELRCATDDADALVDLMWVAGTTGVAIEVLPGGVTRLLAGFVDDSPGTAARVESLRLLAPNATVDLAAPAESTWRIYAQPYRVGPFGLRLPEHQPVERSIDLCIEPGDAFGSGSHESTRLALAALARLDLAGRAIADVGTGTGVLAVAAALLGASVIDAVDVDETAIAVARANAERNNVDVQLRTGSVQQLSGPYDVIIANVTAGIQQALAYEITGHLAPDARVVLAGVLDAQVGDMVELYPNAGLVDRTGEAGWSCLVFASRQPS